MKIAALFGLAILFAASTATAQVEFAHATQEQLHVAYCAGVVQDRHNELIGTLQVANNQGSNAGWTDELVAQMKSDLKTVAYADNQYARYIALMLIQKISPLELAVAKNQGEMDYKALINDLSSDNPILVRAKPCFDPSQIPY